MTVQKAAAEFIHWFGQSGNCLIGDRSHFEDCRRVVQEAPSLLHIEEGPQGPCDIIAALGNLLAYRTCENVLGAVYNPETKEWEGTERPSRHAGWGCGFAPVSIGGFSQPVASFQLAEGSPSRWVPGLYAGGAICLTKEDAAALGVTGARRFRRDAPAVEALFGANVSD